MALSEARRAVIQRRYDQADEALHLLKTGKAVEQFIDQNGEQVKYTKADIGKLEDYVSELDGLLNPAVIRTGWTRPMRFKF